MWYKWARHIRYVHRCHTVSYCHHDRVSPCRPLQIVSRYDIIVILEVVDISGESVKTFLDALNEWVLKIISGNVMERRRHEAKNTRLFAVWGLTRSIATPWRSAVAWDELVTRSSSCFCTGEPQLVAQGGFWHVQQFVSAKYQFGDSIIWNDVI